MDDFSLSVIIPVYNGIKYMDKCLESLENQSIKPDEVIIGDDCSSDDTYVHLKKYIENSSLNIKLFKNKENSGPGYTRNVAKNMATSKYLAFCDADDWYELNFVEEMKKIAATEKPDLIIFDNYNVVNGKQRVSGTTHNMSGTDKKLALALYPMSLWRFVVLSIILKEIDFPSLYNGEDGAVAPQIIAKSNKTVIIDKPFYNYFFREGSASLKPSPRVYKGSLEAFAIISKKLGKLYPDEVEFIGIKNICYGATLNALKANIEKIEIQRFLCEFKAKYPKWEKNKYIKQCSVPKRFFLLCLRCNFYCMLKVFAIMHQKMTS